MAQQLQQGLFLALAGVAVVAALGVIFNRNAVHSALSLLANFVALAMLYVLLNAQFIAIVQVAVYAGAIVVLFLFVVMLLGAGGEMQMGGWLNWRTAFIVAAALVLLTLTGTAVFEGTINGAIGTATPEQIAQVGQTEAVGTALFTDYLLPFELASVLLLVGMLGAVVLGQRWRGAIAGRPSGEAE
ncbi:MAG: NADH-quinone oxidoreductase subunit J [Anaerolineales bacterium]|nr:MAG: NADH-quinone oxidoreductase subunit J [Anaerolineales bacterium]